LKVHYSFRFLLAVLAVWRVTHLFSKEDGPWDIMSRLRRGLKDRFLGRLLSCFYCLSIWVGVPFALFIQGTVIERIIVWLALSGAAVLLERITGESLDMKIEDE
jgi:hypothetical protein